MPDQPVREIQLGGKQLVFLFMASVVLAVAIFLLGISVGRGVHGTVDTAAQTTDATTATDVAALAPAEMPPPTETTAADLRYHDQLQGQTTPPAQSAPPAAATPPPVPVEEPTPADDQPADQKTAPVAAPAAAPAAARAAETPAPAPAKAPAKATAQPAGTWFVQVDAFRSRDNAARQVASLKAKGYPALMSSAAGLYRVRVGPFVERAEADRIRQRLQREEGLKPSLQR